jgi:hypothetical protein
LTTVLGWSRERVVRAMVSAARSAEKRGGKAWGSIESAVRQTPLTAMLSPVCRREASVGAAMVMRVAPAVGVTERMVPVVSMSPVNIRTGYRV